MFVILTDHDQENITRVKGYEGAGGYEAILNYTVGWGQAIAIVDSSNECAQFMRWDCHAAIIHNPYNPDTWTTFWMNRTEQMPIYFGGATPGSDKCACGMTYSCVNTSLPCNCDQNGDFWTFDEGFVTNKPELPIHSFYAGDTGLYLIYVKHIYSRLINYSFSVVEFFCQFCYSQFLSIFLPCKCKLCTQIADGALTCQSAVRWSNTNKSSVTILIV